ncbi:hypothetical protein A9P82_04545 [Arachidicoccus ginsenosidimutans]|uniref:hypothetical protein n=1 Tax=Arachidicoccus sp. BS20 TaxID=1850526 RepID=UPI0007F1036A|nr:hypothetical protein [Arachidicoccus sp. BS20]ANI88619.1 hypothetical protein A9P82_04545 [Arachidicoccus sp. BS20]
MIDSEKYKKMDLHDYNVQIEIVQMRYNFLNLSFEQAEKVLAFEDEKDFYTTKYALNVWEEQDLMYDYFKRALDKTQFEKLNRWYNQQEENYKKQLLEDDGKRIVWIHYYEELIETYQKQIIPKFIKKTFDSYISLPLFQEKIKIDYLKHEYKKYLESEKIHIFSAHFREYRTYAPNRLKEVLLIHKRKYISPNYLSFKHFMDEPTKAIADFLLKSLNYIDREHQTFFDSIKMEWESVVEKIKIKHIKEDVKGWTTVIKNSEQEIKEQNIMQVILFDKDFYNYQANPSFSI